MMELINNRGMRDWMIFIKVAEVGNLSRAARELDISISAVSKSLSRLENSIEVLTSARFTSLRTDWIWSDSLCKHEKDNISFSPCWMNCEIRIKLSEGV